MGIFSVVYPDLGTYSDTTETKHMILPWQLPRSATEFKINFCFCLFVFFFKLMLNVQVNSYDHAGMLSS